jgi:citronellol/citronellal dehydrogenase
VFLLSEASAFINGTVMRVDGGVPNARHSWPLADAARIVEFNGFSRYRPPVGLQEQADNRSQATTRNSDASRS